MLIGGRLNVIGALSARRGRCASIHYGSIEDRIREESPSFSPKRRTEEKLPCHDAPSGTASLHASSSPIRKVQVFIMSFEQWREENPGKKFHQYYVETISAEIEAGKAHGTCGVRLKRNKVFGKAGKGVCKLLRAEGMERNSVCVDSRSGRSWPPAPSQDRPA